MSTRNNGRHAATLDNHVSLTENLGRSLHAGTETAQAAMKTLATAAKDVGNRAVAARDSVSGFIENRPLTSVLIAVGIGALAARMFARR